MAEATDDQGENMKYHPYIWLIAAICFGMMAMITPFFVEDLIARNRQWGLAVLSSAMLLIVMAFYSLLTFNKRKKHILVVGLFSIILAFTLFMNGLIFTVWYLPK